MSDLPNEQIWPVCQATVAMLTVATIFAGRSDLMLLEMQLCYNAPIQCIFLLSFNSPETHKTHIFYLRFKVFKTTEQHKLLSGSGFLMICNHISLIDKKLRLSHNGMRVV